MSTQFDEQRIYQAALKDLEREIAETKFIDECLAIVPERDSEAKLAIREAHLARRNKSEIFNFEPLRINNPELYKKIMSDYGLLKFLEHKFNK